MFLIFHPWLSGEKMAGGDVGNRVVASNGEGGNIINRGIEDGDIFPEPSRLRVTTI